MPSGMGCSTVLGADEAAISAAKRPKNWSIGPERYPRWSVLRHHLTVDDGKLTGGLTREGCERSVTIHNEVHMSV
ncbi:unnamed protein product [Nippostrongylus brasiliensis]|uniref:Transposase n=1 Tax=Nippostrongylus brasiliensis TaxID=27835 RepID=A0A0N4XLA5_NIPBR|nr:unnamed protein product [Nippostrongylus brasiliensis]